MEANRELLSIVASKDGREVHVHVDERGLLTLRRIVERAEALLASGRSDHLHVFSSAWASDGELTEWMPPQELGAESNQVHHLKLFFHGSATRPEDANAV
ncbi:MAG: immunity protein 32 [Betaproteobacteria bacterium]|nr:immunity protein 32 [Betaproteobacteria bacterium]